MSDYLEKYSKLFEQKNLSRFELYNSVYSLLDVYKELDKSKDYYLKKIYDFDDGGNIIFDWFVVDFNKLKTNNVFDALHKRFTANVLPCGAKPVYKNTHEPDVLLINTKFVKNGFINEYLSGKNNFGNCQIIMMEGISTNGIKKHELARILDFTTKGIYSVTKPQINDFIRHLDHTEQVYKQKLTKLIKNS
jgi:hypothetical protein